MKTSTVSALLALLAATLACSIFVGGPSYPESTAVVSTAPAASVQDQIQQAISAGAASGEISLELTQEQLTSYVEATLATQANPILSDPQILLRDGQIELYGKARSGIFEANISMFLQASVDQDGQPQLQITQTDLGPLAAPQGFNEAMAAFVREAFTGWLGPVATGFRLESIKIGDGVMTVSGRIK